VAVGDDLIATPVRPIGAKTRHSGHGQMPGMMASGVWNMMGEC
jgi:hypothetical protein